MPDAEEPAGSDLLAAHLGPEHAPIVEAVLEEHGLVVLERAELARLLRIEASYERLSTLVTGPDVPIV